MSEKPEYLRLLESLIAKWDEEHELMNENWKKSESKSDVCTEIDLKTALLPEGSDVEQLPPDFRLSVMSLEEQIFLRKIEEEIRNIDDSLAENRKNAEELQLSIFKLPAPEKAKLATSLLEFFGGEEEPRPLVSPNYWCRDWTYGRLGNLWFYLLKEKMEFAPDALIDFLQKIQQNPDLFDRAVHGIAFQIGHHLKKNALDSELKAEIEKIIKHLSDSQNSGYRRYLARLRELLPPAQLENPINLGEPWADRAIEFIKRLEGEQKEDWLKLLNECAVNMDSKPTSKWLKTVKDCRQSIGLENFQATVIEWFGLVDKPRTVPIDNWRGDADLIQEINADILKGLVWLCADINYEQVTRALSRLTVSTYRKIPQVGVRSAKIGNACIWVLSQMSDPSAIAQLAILKAKIKFSNAQKSIEKAFHESARKAGIPREEIEEMSVPTYGLTEVGLLRETWGEFTVELAIVGTNKTAVRWFRADGKPQKSVPQATKDNFTEELKELKQAEKDIQKMLSAQRDRIESLYRLQKSWQFSTWKERYLDHPLLGYLSRKLLWQFSAGEHYAVGIWHDGQICDRSQQPIGWLSEATTVTLWHPISASVEVISEWRNWLMEREIQQPFKQAFREIYLLTPAEEATNTYSNRFSAHIIKQHQFNALCSQRGWKNALRLMVDSGFPAPFLALPHWQIRAEYWVDGVGDRYEVDTNETGTYHYLTTDQVRFYPINAQENYSYSFGGGYQSQAQNAPIPLSQIPALVFSEVMRDVDLFVGVCSVGNDPNWVNGNLVGEQRDYWNHYSFGELSATAETRRQVLENLMPRLKKIRDRCEFKDRFLVVRGDIRTYKIHLGSGNILMEPNDAYLCIVKAQEYGNDKVFLPFEGDKTLAVILSKAFLLAEDTKITDPTILRQIR